MGEHYILPSELAALIGFWFAPPLLVALGAQLWLFTARGVLRHHRWRAVGALLATACVSVVVGVAALLASPAFLPRWLGATELPFGGRYWSVLPLSFVVVALIAPMFAWWAVHYAKAEA